MDPAAGRGPEPALDPALESALTIFAGRGSLLVALDFDGVCAPLVDDPATSRMLPGTRAALGRLEESGCRVALVSGRSLASLVQVADPEPGWLVVGGHGAEVMDQIPGEEVPGDQGAGEQGAEAAGDTAVALLDPDQAALLVELTAEVEAVVADAPGAAVEHKPTAVVLHTRLADPETALHATERVLEGPGTRPGVHVKRGHDVVELAVLRADKGTALRALRDRTGVSAVLYAGDDVTDEDAFAALDADAGDVIIKVGPGATLAAHRVGVPEDVTAVLDRLDRLVARTRHSPRPA